jgi:uncharacterized protein (DUF934 family)
MREHAIAFVDPATDPWRAAGAQAPLTLAQWRAARDTWPPGLHASVAVANDEDIEALADDLPRIAFVALHFPKWTDGRAYSQARLLRARYRFAGDVRATGEVLVDMLQQLVRTGFSSVQLAPDQPQEAAERALGFFTSHYQGDVQQTRPWFLREAA